MKKKKLTPAQKRKRMLPLIAWEDKQRATWLLIGAVLAYASMFLINKF